MTRLVSLLLLMLVGACDQAPPPAVSSSPGPDDAGAPSTDRPYRPVMAGTVDHGIGERP
jgi:hypothetical protein